MTGTQPRDVCPGMVEMLSSVSDGRALISLVVHPDVSGAQNIDVTDVAAEQIEDGQSRLPAMQIKGDIAFDPHALGKSEGAAFVQQSTVPEDATLESVVVQDDALAVKGALDIVQFTTPVGVGITTVAEAGGASSAPGGGH